MTSRRRELVFFAAAVIVLCVVIGVFAAARNRSLQLDSRRFEVTGGGSAPLTELQALLLVPGRVFTARGIAPPFRARMRIEMSHFDEFEIGVAGGTYNVSLVFDRDHYPNRFAFGQIDSLEIAVEPNRVTYILDGAVNDRLAWAIGRADRVFVNARRSQFRLLDIEVRAGADGHGPLLLRGPFVAKPAGSWRAVGIIALALLIAAALLAVELGIGRLLRVELARVTGSWLAIATPVAVGLCLAARYQWVGSLLAPAPLIWLFHRLRFWLIATTVFALRRTSARRFAYAVLGLAIVGFVTFRTVQIGTSLDWRWSGVAGIIAAGVLAGCLWLFARDAGLSFRHGADVVGPAFLPFVFLLPLTVMSTDRSGLAALLPLSLLCISFPISKHRRSLRHHGLLMLVIVALATAGLELGLRLSNAAAYLRPLNIGRTFDTDRDLFWAPKGLFGDSGNWLEREDLHVRRIAFRGRENTPLIRPPGVTRILVMGGSNAWGDGQPNNATTFCGLLETRLRERGYVAEVLNGGVKGFNAFQVMVLLTKYALAYRPDIVVLFLARNDVAQDAGLYTYRELWAQSRSGSYRLLISTQEQLRRSLLYNGLTRLVVNLRQRAQGRWYDPRLWKPANPVADFKQNLIDMVDAARHAGSRVVLATEFWGEPFLTPGGTNNARIVELLQAMRDVAREKNVPLLDTWRYFSATPDPLHWVLVNDPVHLNAEGHAEVARLLDQFLRQNGLLP